MTIDRKAIAYASETASGCYVILKLKDTEKGTNVQFQCNETYPQVQMMIEHYMARELQIAQLMGRIEE